MGNDDITSVLAALLHELRPLISSELAFDYIGRFGNVEEFHISCAANAPNYDWRVNHTFYLTHDDGQLRCPELYDPPIELADPDSWNKIIAALTKVGVILSPVQTVAE